LLVQRWFHVLAATSVAGAATAQDMLAHLQGRAELEPLVANPMLLTAMCIIYHQGNRLPQDKYDLYDRIVDNVLYNRYEHDPMLIDLVRNRLSVLAHGMHLGPGPDEQWSTPRAEATYAELDRMLQAYHQQTSWTEPGFRTAVETREQLLSHTGLLLPRGDRRAAFYHLSFQEFLAAQRILDVECDRLLEVFIERAAAAEWRKRDRAGGPPRQPGLSPGRSSPRQAGRTRRGKQGCDALSGGRRAVTERSGCGGALGMVE
jgi:hypothetical protein